MVDVPKIIPVLTDESNSFEPPKRLPKLLPNRDPELVEVLAENDDDEDDEEEEDDELPDLEFDPPGNQ